MSRLVPSQSLRNKPFMCVASVGRSILDFALPPRCPGCGIVVQGDDELCVDCWRSLDFLTGSGCVSCGVPIAPGIAICGPCLAQPPQHDGAASAVIYGKVARQIILRLKHGRRIGLSRLVAHLMSRHIPEGDWLIVPVPLHRWRIWSRGFNQSALIARHLADQSGLPMSPDALDRYKRTPVLGGLSAKGRRDVLRSAFGARNQVVTGRRILLIDDVYTSGATTNACARALKRSGAVEVRVLCWARVVLGTDPD
jgi:ComF family protein